MNTTATPRSRSTSKQETRQALLRAAMTEFAAKGFDAPSLDAICARAGYTRGAFYVHFHDREDLVTAVMEDAFGVLLDAIIASEGEGDDLETTVGRFTALTALLPPASGFEAATAAGGADADPIRIAPLHQILEASRRSSRVRDGFVSLLEEAVHRVAIAARDGQKAGKVRGDVSEDAIATVLTLIALGVRVALDVGLPLDAKSIPEAAVQLLRPQKDAAR